ncbi:MAG: signal peptidase I [Deltaproteobacteria bacterium]|nr:signal peptidase I [Deltaproteobacteria bacterium]
MEVLVVSVILALFVRTWVAQVFRIPSDSMKPHLMAGDHVLVNKFIFGPKANTEELKWLPQRLPRPGDVALFRFPPDPQRDFIKRCVAGPLEKVRIEDKRLLVDDQPLEEAGYVVHLDERTYSRSLFLDDGYRLRDNFGPLQVPEGYYFFLGDNRDGSYDSRYWGPVPGSFIRGRPWLVLWSVAEEEEKRSEDLRTPRLVR